MWKGASENSLNVCDYANQGRHRKHLHLASGSDMNIHFRSTLIVLQSLGGFHMILGAT